MLFIRNNSNRLLSLPFICFLLSKYAHLISALCCQRTKKRKCSKCQEILMKLLLQQFAFNTLIFVIVMFKSREAVFYRSIDPIKHFLLVFQRLQNYFPWNALDLPFRHLLSDEFKPRYFKIFSGREKIVKNSQSLK